MNLFVASIVCAVLFWERAALCQQAPQTEPRVKIVSKSWVGGGFFAEFKQVIHNLVYRCCDKIPRTLVVDWSQEFFPYKDDITSNGWDLYFEPIHSQRVYEKKQCPPEPKHDHPHCIQRWLRYRDFLPYRRFMHEKIEQYITIKSDILEKVDSFYLKHMQDYYCIGVHVRFAYAHTPENPKGKPLELQHYIDEVKAQLFLHRHRNPRIFLATDSQYVVEVFAREFKKEQLVFTDAFRAEYREDPHLIYEDPKYYLSHPEEFHRYKPGFQGGLMALVDCLLLSRCDVFIHSTSNVADCAAWFNPELQSVFLPKNLKSRPCSCEALLDLFRI